MKSLQDRTQLDFQGNTTKCSWKCLIAIRDRRSLADRLTVIDLLPSFFKSKKDIKLILDDEAGSFQHLRISVSQRLDIRNSPASYHSLVSRYKYRIIGSRSSSSDIDEVLPVENIDCSVYLLTLVKQLGSLIALGQHHVRYKIQKIGHDGEVEYVLV